MIKFKTIKTFVERRKTDPKTCILGPNRFKVKSSEYNTAQSDSVIAAFCCFLRTRETVMTMVITFLDRRISKAAEKVGYSMFC